MKKYNIALAIVLILFIFAIGGYIFLLDKIHNNKAMQINIENLNSALVVAQKPMIRTLTSEELEKEQEDMKIFMQKFSLQADISKIENSFIIDGTFGDTAEYVLFKKFVKFLDGGNYRIDDICLGKNCNKHPYGFFIKVTPYKPNL